MADQYILGIFDLDFFLIQKWLYYQILKVIFLLFPVPRYPVYRFPIYYLPVFWYLNIAAVAVIVCIIQWLQQSLNKICGESRNRDI